MRDDMWILANSGSRTREWAGAHHKSAAFSFFDDDDDDDDDVIVVVILLAFVRVLENHNPNPPRA